MGKTNSVQKKFQIKKASNKCREIQKAAFKRGETLPLSPQYFNPEYKEAYDIILKARKEYNLENLSNTAYRHKPRARWKKASKRINKHSEKQAVKKEIEKEQSDT